jgi:hypothetical protein
MTTGTKNRGRPIYFGFWFVLKGFESKVCENYEKEIGNLEESTKFKDYLVCNECNKKLSLNQDD